MTNLGIGYWKLGFYTKVCLALNLILLPASMAASQ